MVSNKVKISINIVNLIYVLLYSYTLIPYINISAFLCVHFGRKFHIPLDVSVECVRNAEKIIHTSYSHSETFSSVSNNIKKSFFKVYKNFIHIT